MKRSIKFRKLLSSAFQDVVCTIFYFLFLFFFASINSWTNSSSASRRQKEMDGFRSGNHETSGRHTRRHFLTRRCRITMRVTSSSFYFSFFFRTRFLVSLKQWDQTLPPLSVTKPGFIFLSFFFFRIISTLLFARYTRYTNEWKK